MIVLARLKDLTESFFVGLLVLAVLGGAAYGAMIAWDRYLAPALHTGRTSFWFLYFAATLAILVGSMVRGIRG